MIVSKLNESKSYTQSHVIKWKKNEEKKHNVSANGVKPAQDTVYRNNLPFSQRVVFYGFEHSFTLSTYILYPYLS